MKLADVNVDQFVIINNVRMNTNADVNAKNQLTKFYVIQDFFGILVIMNASVINHVLKENISITKVVNIETNQLINQLRNVVKILTGINWLIITLNDYRKVCIPKQYTLYYL